MVNNYPNEHHLTKLEAQANECNHLKINRFWGHVTLLSGDKVNISGLAPIATLGDQVSVLTDAGTYIDGEIIKITGHETVAILYEEPAGITVGSKVEHTPENSIRPHSAWVGHIVDYHGRDANGPSLARRHHRACAQNPATKSHLPEKAWIEIKHQPCRL